MHMFRTVQLTGNSNNGKPFLWPRKPKLDFGLGQLMEQVRKDSHGHSEEKQAEVGYIVS